MPRLDDKVVLITGTGGGQGREAALQFTAAGARVVGCDIRADTSEETLALVRAAGGDFVSMHPVDLRDPAAVERWIDDCIALHGRIDVLYNNASAPRHAPVGSFPLDDWHFTIDSELHSVFYVTRFAWPHLVASRGVVINIASTAGIRGSTPGGLAHATAKAGVIGMTKHLALEGAPHGIRVLSISPGGIETPAIAAYGKAHPEDLKAAVAKNLIPRLGQPAEIVRMALFLASDDAAYMTGENVVIDGGRTTCTHW
ncbi:MAG: SDR family oxidoreductase [Spirochaetaceae bacterium]|nr:SDR family oxidoreductase [Myxococcales bacterium]MCB9726677.1 SDR family oxidoreductase [Spirochaetaceae bacterium]HPG25239.1 SDR family NAD(P)-dependent oxidoreductase [Myxococcota bacterium]